MNSSVNVCKNLKPTSLLCTDYEVNSTSPSQAVHGKNDLMSSFLSIAISFSLL